MEEKMLILKMLQEGKITTDEAVKLLEALEKGGSGTPSSGSKINELKDELTAKLNEIKIDEKLNKFGEKASKLASTFGEKAGKLVEQLGENINTDKTGNNAEKFAEEFTKKMEILGQDIAESAAKFADVFTSQIDNFFDTVYEKNKYNSSYTYPVEDALSIYLETSNFSVKACPGDTKEIKINLYVNSNVPQLAIDEYFKVIKDTEGYRFSTEFPGRTWGKIEILLPKGMDVISFSTNNAKCEISDMDVNHISCTTANGRVILTKCSADKMEILTDNERIIFNEVSARTANIRTSNSKIAIEGSRLDNIDAKTSNAAIVVSTSRKGDSLNPCYTLNTSNGKIDFSLTGEEGFEYMVDTRTTMSSIDVKLANLTYETEKNNIGMQGSVQLKSENFDTASNKISIMANTSNAPINIKNI